MKIVVLSDIHFGHAPTPEQEDDPYNSVAEVADRTGDADLYIIPGDLFDMKVPSPETLARAMESLAELSAGEQPGIVTTIGGKKIRNHPGTRVVAIHGTHERRAEGLVNPVHILEKAGFLIHLEKNGIVLESKGQKVAIQGLSGVPDQFTAQTLADWAPKPVPGCFNIMMLHQNMTEFMPSQVEHTLDKDFLPKGFNLYLNGHIHKPEQSSVHGKPLIITGSLVTTQISGTIPENGFWEIVVDEGIAPQISFHKLEKQRSSWLVELGSPDLKQAKEKVADAIIRAKDQTDKKPIIKVKVTGKRSGLAKELRALFKDQAILSVRQEQPDSQPAERKTLEDHKLSVNELGARLLSENLEKAGLNTEAFASAFELLLAGRKDEALKLLEGSELKVKKKKSAKNEESSDNRSDDKYSQGNNSAGKNLTGFLK